MILAFFAIRLLMKSIWRISFLAVRLTVGLAACALYAIPQTRWLLGWWARVWDGMLAPTCQGSTGVCRRHMVSDERSSFSIVA
jgi:hypothetical protein